MLTSRNKLKDKSLALQIARKRLELLEEIIHEARKEQDTQSSGGSLSSDEAEEAASVNIEAIVEELCDNKQFAEIDLEQINELIQTAINRITGIRMSESNKANSLVTHREAFQKYLQDESLQALHPTILKILQVFAYLKPYNDYDRKTAAYLSVNTHKPIRHNRVFLSSSGYIIPIEDCVQCPEKVASIIGYDILAEAEKEAFKVFINENVSHAPDVIRYLSHTYSKVLVAVTSVVSNVFINNLWDTQIQQNIIIPLVCGLNATADQLRCEVSASTVSMGSFALQFLFSGAGIGGYHLTMKLLNYLLDPNFQRVSSSDQEIHITFNNEPTGATHPLTESLLEKFKSADELSLPLLKD